MENAVTESDRLSGIDENVCILHGNIWNMVLGIDEKYETLSIYLQLMYYLRFRGSSSKETFLWLSSWLKSSWKFATTLPNETCRKRRWLRLKNNGAYKTRQTNFLGWITRKASCCFNVHTKFGFSEKLSTMVTIYVNFPSRLELFLNNSDVVGESYKILESLSNRFDWNFSTTKGTPGL